MEWIPIILLFFKLSVLFIGMFFAIKWHYDQDRKDEDNGPQFPSEMRLFAAMLVALALSLIGIVYAGLGQRGRRGRGGA
jgi:heme/copper-type cytochrome/quinol oxidase subunit 2